MPYIQESTYHKHPTWQFNRHLQTMMPSMFRKVEGVDYERERIDISDGDFLDLDWVQKGSSKLMIVSHGLEGHSDRHYVKGMVKSFSQNGWDALAWNCRACSGEMNRLPRMYHHGATEDLRDVVNHVLKNHAYEDIALVGFSMGGSLTLKYLGEEGKSVSPRIKGGTAISVPFNLVASLPTIHAASNWIYKKRFLRKLARKVRAKALMFPELIDTKGLDKISTFDEFDNRYTAPLHGFKNATHFYQTVSAHQYAPNIAVPTLIVNAANDPLLPKECYPIELAKKHPFIHLEVPRKGGHVGFMLPKSELTWADKRALEFMDGVIGGGFEV
ncbi:MAG: YheT family hydrolase [Chitinophagales bacterium]